MHESQTTSLKDSFDKLENCGYFSAISSSEIGEYENGFLNCLLESIKADKTLSHFYVRIICECVNVMKVIEQAKEIDIMELEEIISNLNKAKNIGMVSQYDTEFHRQLFVITGEIRFFKWWRSQAEDLHGFQVNIWESVGYKTEQFNELLSIHTQIFKAIKNRNRNDAKKQMQRHFSFVLFQLLGTLYDFNKKNKPIRIPSIR